MSFKIEYGVLTEKQIAAGQDKTVVCNLNIVLYHDGKPVGNIIGCKVIQDSKGRYQFSSNSNRNGDNYFNFTGFTKAAKDAIIVKARAHEKAGTLTTKWSFRSEYNRRSKASLKVEDTAVKPDGVKAEDKVFSG